MKKLSFCWLILLLSLLSACGNNSATTNLDVVMTDHAYFPNTYLVPAGKEITLSLQNNGAVTHEFIIMKYGTDVGSDFGAEDNPNIYWQTELVAGQGDSFTFTAPSQPGDYQVVCGMPGHFLAGMVARLTVVVP